MGVIALLALAGCGGSDSPSDEADDPVAAETSTTEGTTTTEAPPPKPPTKDEYIAAADKLCKEAAVKGQKIFDRQIEIDKEVSAGVTPDELRKLFEESAKLTRQRLDIRNKVTEKIRALEPPKSGPAKRYLAQRDATSKLQEPIAKAVEAYAKAQDQATSDAIGAAITAADKGSDKDLKLAEDFGFKQCGQRLKF